MGGERAGKGKCLFLCLACLVIILTGFGGCISYVQKAEGDRSIKVAKSLMTKEEYHASLERSEDVLVRYPATNGDQSLMLMGLLYAHPRNPDLDYRKSLEYFNRLRDEFPSSDLADEAGLWVLTIGRIIEKDKEIGILIEQKKNKKNEVAGKQKKIKILQGQISDLQSRLNILHGETKKMSSQIYDLSEQIRRLKEIDLRIEEQKRRTIN